MSQSAGFNDRRASSNGVSGTRFQTNDYSSSDPCAQGVGGNGNVYKELIDSNDLVKELDDIEAISQQISQHAEVLYQSWKNNRDQKRPHQTDDSGQVNDGGCRNTSNCQVRNGQVQSGVTPRSIGSSVSPLGSHQHPLSSRNDNNERSSSAASLESSRTARSGMTSSRSGSTNKSMHVTQNEKCSEGNYAVPAGCSFYSDDTSTLRSPKFISSTASPADRSQHHQTMPSFGRSHCSPSPVKFLSPNSPSAATSRPSQTSLLLQRDNNNGSSPAVDLLASPETNSDLEDLVSSFVSTDRAKRAARQTIANTIATMSKRDGNGLRNSSSSSAFGGVSPLRSPMLAARSSFSATTGPRTGTTLEFGSPRTGTVGGGGDSLSPSGSSTSSTLSSSVDYGSSSSPTTSDLASMVHTKLSPIFKSPHSTFASSPPGSSSPSLEARSISIPVQHVFSPGNKDSRNTIKPLRTNLVVSNDVIDDSSVRSEPAGLRSPRVLRNLTDSSLGAATEKHLTSPPPNVSQRFSTGRLETSSSLPSLHAANIENMRQKFEEAKRRMNLMHRSMGANAFGVDDPFDGDLLDHGGDGSHALEDPSVSSRSSFLFDQFRRRVARSRRETPFAPHPELTPQQRQHISQRSASTPNLTHSQGIHPSRRLGGSSVAERVLIFERAPTLFGGTAAAPESRVGAGGGGGGTTFHVDKAIKELPSTAAWKSGLRSAEKDDCSQASHHQNVESTYPKTSISSQTKVRNIPIIKASSSLPSLERTLQPLQPLQPLTVAPPPDSTEFVSNKTITPSSSTSNVQDLTPNSSSPTSTQVQGLLLGVGRSEIPSETVSAQIKTNSLASRPEHPSAVPSVSRGSSSSRPASIIITGKEKILPKFHFPFGNPEFSLHGDGNLSKFSEEFRKHKNATVTLNELGQILKDCGYPSCWRSSVFVAAGGSCGNHNNINARDNALSLAQFSEFWRRMTSFNHDEASQFVYVVTSAADAASNTTTLAGNLNSPSILQRTHSTVRQQPRSSRRYVLPEDLVPLIQDVVDSHPGLGFLKEATEFHSRYVHTVISRVFYVVNRSWSGSLTIEELRHSNFLPTLHLLEEEDDINAITDFFSYEHFYVIYCKFWELDKDHDLFIDREDLARHNDHAISTRMIDRIFSGTVTRGSSQKEGRMSYTEFVWFLLAEEDKHHPTAIEYWFRCMDLDGDGILSMYELEYFYEEQLQRMEQLGIETLPFEDCLCQMLDMIGPKRDNVISLTDLRNCRMTPIFFDTFFNLEKYLDHEQRDPFASQRELDEDGNEVTDWDRFAAEEYELLVAEEGNTDATMDELCYEDDGNSSSPEVQMEQVLDTEQHQNDKVVANA